MGLIVDSLVSAEVPESVKLMKDKATNTAF